VSIEGDGHSFVVWRNEQVVKSVAEGETGDAKAAARDPLLWQMHQHNKEAHTGTLNYLATFRHDNEAYFVSMCSDGLIRLWIGAVDTPSQFTLKSELLFGRNL